MGSVGDSYDNTIAETINGLYKADVIHRQPWKNREVVELATLTWVDGFNHRPLLGPGISLRPKPKQGITNNFMSLLLPHDSQLTAYGKTRAIQSDLRVLLSNYGFHSII